MTSPEAGSVATSMAGDVVAGLPADLPADLPTDLPAAHQTAVRAAAAWAARSRGLAAAGEVRLAVQTQWAADVATLHCLLWESGLADVADPAAHLDTVATVVQGALGRAGETAGDASAVVGWARTAMARAFGPSVEELLRDRFTNVEHLDSLGAVPVGSPRSDRGPDALAADLRTVALDCSVVARAMTAAGLPEDAMDQARRAILATFEAALISTSATHAEAWPTAVDLRWELAVARLHDHPWHECEPDLVTAELVAAVPPADRDALRTQFGALW